MKAAVFHKPHDIRLENVPDAENEQPSDVVVKVSATAICGSDLHIYNGFFPQLETMALGHEVCKSETIDAVGMEAKTNLFEKAANVINLQSGSSKILEQAIHTTRRGGRISSLGIYSTNYDNFPLGPWIDKSLQIWGGQAPVHNYIDELIQMIEGGKIRTDDVITHSLKLADVSKAYTVFNKKEYNCVKVVMKP